MKKIISSLVICIILFSGLLGSQTPVADKQNTHYIKEIIQINFPKTDLISIGNDQYITLPTCNIHIVDGSPKLPSKSILITLPPKAMNPSYQVQDCTYEKLDGAYNLKTSSDIICYEPSNNIPVQTSFQQYKNQGVSNHQSMMIYPREPILKHSFGSFSDIPYISLNLCPFKYRQSTGELFYTEKMNIVVSYEISDIDLHEKSNLQIKLFSNNDIEEDYINYFDTFKQNENSNYVIITTSDLIDCIEESDFIDWKTALGFSCKIVTISDDIISGQSGTDLAEKIRSFLRQYYQEWNIKYVLIIGDYKAVPMRYCYPNPTNHRLDPFDITSGEIPTDYYYADLSFPDDESWDLDGDGFYGEYDEDQPDFLAEVFVGRIPINTENRITYTLNKIVRFESDTSSWKNHALHAGAFFYFEDEDNLYNEMDGAVLSYHIEQDLMENWFVSHYSEQEGLHTSDYKWSTLSSDSFIQDWKLGSYAIVNWQGHGWTTGVARKVWSWDDGDNIPEANEIKWPFFITVASDLDDDYPSIVTAVSCYVGCPEPNNNGNLGIKLLTDPSFGAGVAVIASARSPYGSINWPSNPGGSDSIIYEFNKNIIKNNHSIGQALFTSKFFCNLEYGWTNYIEYIDMYTFNLFGDPSLMLYGDNENIPPETPVIIGPQKGTIHETVSYDISSTDLNNDTIKYFIEFEEGKGYWTEEMYLSGHIITESWTWDKEGTYTIKVQAEDEHGEKSDWGVLQVGMPKNKIIDILFNYWMKRHPILSFLINYMVNTSEQ